MKKIVWLCGLVLGLATVAVAQSSPKPSAPLTTLNAFFKFYKKHYMNDTKVNMTSQDEKNGYYSFCSVAEGQVDCSPEGTDVEMAIWKKADGTPIFGLSSHSCPGVFCGDQEIHLQFFNSKMEDITSQLVDLEQLKAIGMHKTLVNNQSAEKEVLGEAYDAERLFTVGIPEKGTSIRLVVSIGYKSTETFAMLNFNKKDGTFTVEEQ